MGPNEWSLVGVVLAVLATLALGFVASWRSKTTSDFLVASRGVKASNNAAAISGEYLSAASFLGVASLVFRDGPDALWYPVGFTAGYLSLLLFVAAPLRRSGAYTVPDFAEARLGSPHLRRLSTWVVMLIGWLYLVPQFQGAGLTFSTVTQLPAWIGVAGVALVVVINVVGGGMRAITMVQAFQYYLKLLAISLPAFLLVIVFLNDDRPQRALNEPLPPTFPTDTVVTVSTPVRVQVVEGVRLEAYGTVDGAPAKGEAIWGPGTPHDIGADTKLHFTAGTAVPVVKGSPVRNEDWLRPQQADGNGMSLFKIYSLIFATFLGTMGLPHILVRFYTNPDGRAARRTTLYVLILLGAFYLFPTILGALSRLYVPQLLVTGKTDVAILLLPTAMLDNWLGKLLAALVAAGAFAAFLSTASGLVVSVAGVLFTDVLAGRFKDFRLAALLAGALPLGMALMAASLDVSQAVSLALATAASTFCPLLVLGIWWRGLTSVGAAAGMIAGGGLTLLTTILNFVSASTGGWAAVPLLQQPAAVTVPVAFVTMVVVSKLSRRRMPPDVSQIMLRLHAPDRLGFTKDREVQKYGTPEEKARQSTGRHRS
ncbi:sodium/solute symporter [Crossiella cryophila]|uniref:Na+(H+)/acetate symporter ActP n=1 Tax=Crossiella cryophila TaxID=43355 RepID=A0A7W7FTR8_9PSEU|nr:cation acetate symporter [Crossiella cryophila]MBB4675069.1 Na+(H+)/acetate symporter ActP [Crossiella cryophila]